MTYEHASDSHIVLLNDSSNVINGIGGIHNETLTRLPVAKEIGKVHHIDSHGISGPIVLST
jgi:hypothetical protein